MLACYDTQASKEKLTTTENAITYHNTLCKLVQNVA